MSNGPSSKRARDRSMTFSSTSPSSPASSSLPRDQVGGERRRIERHAEIGGEIGHRADMVLMRVGQDDAEQVVAPFLDEVEIGEDQVDAGIVGRREGHAEIDHQPLAAGSRRD